MFLDVDRREPLACAVRDDSGETLSYGELAGFAQRLEGVVTRRALAFCLCANDCGTLAGYFALYDNRVVPLLLDAGTDSTLLSNLVDTYGPEYLWCPDGHNDAEPLVAFKGYKLVRLNGQSPALHEDLALLLTTSGSTGSPKLVRHKYGNQEHNARVVADVFGWTEKSRGLCQLPMHYTMGLNVISSLLHAGSTVLLSNSSLMSKTFWQRLKEEQATSFTGVPYSYEILLKMKLLRMDLPHLEVLASGGGKLPEANFVKLAEYAASTGKKFFSTFGTTETSARMAYLPPELASSKTGSIGRPFPGGEMYLIDDDGRKIEQTEAEGELIFRGANVTMGYAQGPSELLLGDDFGGEYRTGDVARRDAEGCYYIVGRKSRFLKLFGHRVGLDSCEQLLQGRFAVEFVCSGTDAEMTVFFTDDKVAAADVCQFLAEVTSLPKTTFKAILTAEIPRFASGKVNYKELAASPR